MKPNFKPTSNFKPNLRIDFRANLKTQLLFLALPLAVGALSAFLTRGQLSLYRQWTHPPLTPPGWVFPIVWGILYILMGISSYLIAVSLSPQRKNALSLYLLQLFLNFLWPIVFFRFQAPLFALLILLLLWYTVFQMIQAFYLIFPLAGILQIPYLLWLTFAAYLNLGIFFLNR